MPIYCCGSNAFGLVNPPDQLQLLRLTLVPNCISFEAASWSQLLARDGGGTRRVCGLPLPKDLPLEPVARWLGHDDFVAALLDDGRIRRLFDGAVSVSGYALAEMNGRGELLVVPADEPSSAHLYPSLDALCSSSSADYPSPLRLLLPSSASNGSPVVVPSSSARTLPQTETFTALASGSAHFLLLTSSSQVYSYGDSRYGQAGPFPSSLYHTSSSPASPPRTVPLNHLSFFDGLYPTQLACGSFHSAVRTREGSVYLFGSDKDGQCGGTGGGLEPEMVDLEREGDEADEEVMQVACGGAHTVLLMASGKVWVAGANHDGQLGLGNTTPRHLFTRCEATQRLAAPGRVRKILCSHSTTFFETVP
ncbi:regulatorof chromosome condensation (RCC1)-like protein [Rhodotorula toruloides]|uniref:Regulatorof chromosome condensation (RCC1)-like protein n=1 Tax=Rhodotorula toruloides TaxID=5286 RepID=A0A511KBL2_RHOTO|nr:regulatorof chromosome condensation (RCC1)-like protein [Rhodotorula toruloides]